MGRNWVESFAYRSVDTAILATEQVNTLYCGGSPLARSAKQTLVSESKGEYPISNCGISLFIRTNISGSHRDAQPILNRNRIFKKIQNMIWQQSQFFSRFCLQAAKMEVRINDFSASEDMNHINPDHDGSQNGPADFDDLVQMARGGDKKAIGQLIDRWRKYLLLIANENLEQELHAKIAPSDIVQQSMMDAQNNIANFRGVSEAEFQAWVRQILRNNVHAARRKYKTSQQRNVKREIEIDDSRRPSPALPNREDSPRTEALKNERASVLDSAMRQLPDHYQQIIQLRNWDDLTFVEIADRLKSTEDSVRKLWSRAVLRLQQVINQDHPGFQSGPIRN